MTAKLRRAIGFRGTSSELLRHRRRSWCGWCDHGVRAVWIAPFTGLSPRCFGKLLTALRREGADTVRRGRPWSLSFEDRVLLVTAYWRTNLTMRQLAPLFGISKSAADRIIDHLGPLLALQPRRRFARDAVLIVDGTLVPTRDHTIASARSCGRRGGSSGLRGSRTIAPPG
ncbi:hypothetical protein GCM10009730_61810 [Streptomyces albidochromogenes]